MCFVRVCLSMSELAYYVTLSLSLSVLVSVSVGVCHVFVCVCVCVVFRAALPQVPQVPMPDLGQVHSW